MVEDAERVLSRAVAVPVETQEELPRSLRYRDILSYAVLREGPFASTRTKAIRIRIRQANCSAA